MAAVRSTADRLVKPYSEASEQNQQPILEVLRAEFAQVSTVLEIGSGTGQHAVYFGRHLPHIRWQTSDVSLNHAGILAWLADGATPNIAPPLELDVAHPAHWPSTTFDAVFSANTAHIMSWPQVQMMFSGIARLLSVGGKFCLYGPFNYAGEYTSDSNARFDQWLKNRDPNSGIKDITELQTFASRHALQLVQDYEMPVNNRTLIWQKTMEKLRRL